MACTDESRLITMSRGSQPSHLGSHLVAGVVIRKWQTAIVVCWRCLLPRDVQSVRACRERIYWLQDQHDHRLRPPEGVVVLLGYRFLSHTTRF